MIYFTSDLHFYHSNVIPYCNRPFGGYIQMNEALIENWNNTVKVKDEVYILGDITMRGPDKVNTLMPQLHGKKYLVRGNHDIFTRKESFDTNNFEWVKDYHSFIYNYKGVSQMFCLMHYPLMTWNFKMRGSVHLHGHIHSTSDYNEENIENGILRFDVGVDAHNYMPVSIDTILEMAERGKENMNTQVDYHFPRSKD